MDAPPFQSIGHELICIVVRKFLGKTNGSAPKPQQSILSFGKPKSTKAAPTEVAWVDGAQTPEEESEVKAVKPEDEDGDVKMTGGPEKKEPNGIPVKEEQVKLEDSMSVAQDETVSTSPKGTQKSPKRSYAETKNEEDDEDDEPVVKRFRKGKSPKPSAKDGKADQSPKYAKSKKNSEPEKPAKSQAKAKDPPKATAMDEQKSSKASTKHTKPSDAKPAKTKEDDDEDEDEKAEQDEDEADSDEEEKPEIAAKAREKVQSTLKSSDKDPYPNWKPGEPVPYAALCTTFSLVEMTTKRLIISAHCSLFLRQVLRLTPQDLLPTVQLMINKLAADYAGIELGIGESLIMKAIGETTGRSLQVIKADQQEIGDLGLVAAKSRGNQPTMFKPKPLTVRGVLDGLMGIATTHGDGSQGKKVAGIKKLLSAADAATAGKGSKGIDITKDKGGASEAKFIIRFLEGKLRLGLAEKTVLVALAHAMVMHETAQKGEKVPSSEKLAQGEAILKAVYRYD